MKKLLTALITLVVLLLPTGSRAQQAPGATVNTFDDAGGFLYYTTQSGVLKRYSVLPLEFATNPTGLCFDRTFAVNVSTQTLFFCAGTAWVQIAGGGGGGSGTVTNTPGPLSNNALMTGNGGNYSKTLGSLGTTTTVLHGNATGAPSFGSVVSADLNITTTSCTNQFLTAISSGGIGTCSTVTLTSAQFANQGTTTTVLHGNAAGNPSFSAVVLTTDVSGVLPTANGGTGQNSTATFPTSGVV